MDEITLGKLSRAQLQKVAKDHGVRANMKSVVIIRELVKLSKAVPIIQDEENEEPKRKKAKTTEEGHPSAGSSAQTYKNPSPSPADPPRKSPSLSQLLESPNGHPAAKDNTSDSGDSYLSYGSPSQQQYYGSPVSSRAGTPPPEEPHMLNRTVSIMKQITTDDQRILANATTLRQRAASLREQARNMRDVVRAERGRRERLEAYFTYWREIAPNWPKDWIYKEGEEDRLRMERVLRTMAPPLPSTGPTGPPTLSFDTRDAP
ncbi:hypothetical protein EDD22DRAFT_957544 [Suillus occidentalis]|nr:hypothetical protein EDD22DRAFT_957544 [Suillus occidentalis]